MKKLLIASTALVATAGMAAAEVTISGVARAGIKYEEGNTVAGTETIWINGDTSTVGNAEDILAEFGDDEEALAAAIAAGTVQAIGEAPTGEVDEAETYIEQRLRFNIDAKATSDAGVAFQARLRIQSDDSGDGVINAARLNAARFSAEAGGLRIDVGNAGGAIDNMPGYYGAYETGLSSFTGQYAGVDYSFAGYSSGGDVVAPTVYGRYASGAFAGAISYSQTANDGDPATSAASEAAIHLAYSFDTFTAAIGYSSTQNAIQDRQTINRFTLLNDHYNCSSV